MKQKVFFLKLWICLISGILFCVLLLCSSCSEDLSDKIVNSDEIIPQPITTLFTSKQPYLICAGRNPAGIGFDFWYKELRGGACEMALLSQNIYKEVNVDMVIRTIKAEKDGKPMGCPFIQLMNGAKAYKYLENKGKEVYSTLNDVTINPELFEQDKIGFDLNGIKVNASGFRSLILVKKQFKKLVIGDKWKECLFNETINDEPIWIIKTVENKYFKVIVSQFPAKNAPTKTGYCIIKWDVIENQYVKE